MHHVEVTDLHEPGTDTFHDFAASFETLAPMGFPLQKIARVQRVGAEFEETTELSRGSGGPEREFLHERGAFAGD